MEIITAYRLKDKRVLTCLKISSELGSYSSHHAVYGSYRKIKVAHPVCIFEFERSVPVNKAVALHIAPPSMMIIFFCCRLS